MLFLLNVLSVVPHCSVISGTVLRNRQFLSFFSFYLIINNNKILKI